MKRLYLLLLSFIVSSETCAKQQSWTSNYHKTSSMQFMFAQSQLPYMQIKPDDIVLDIGCGTGRTTNLFAEHLPEGSIIGIDFSEDVIDFATKEYSTKNNLLFEAIDAAELEYIELFDVIYSFFCLQWLDDKQKAIDGIARALKKNGRVYIFVPISSKDYAIGLECILETLENHPEWKPYCTIPNNEQAETWINRFEKSGFIVTGKRIVEKKVTYSSKKDWNKYCSGLGITTLPEQEKERFITQTNDLLYQKYDLDDNAPYIRTNNILCLELAKVNQ